MKAIYAGPSSTGTTGDGNTSQGSNPTTTAGAGKTCTHKGVLEEAISKVTVEVAREHARCLGLCLKAHCCRNEEGAQQGTSHVSIEICPQCSGAESLLQSTADKTLGIIVHVGSLRALWTRQAQHGRCMRRVANAGSSNTPDNGSNILGATPATSSVKDAEGGMSVVPGSVAARVGVCPTALVHVCYSFFDQCRLACG